MLLYLPYLYCTRQNRSRHPWHNPQLLATAFRGGCFARLQHVLVQTIRPGAALLVFEGRLPPDPYGTSASLRSLSVINITQYHYG
jgi:hypothetical protein